MWVDYFLRFDETAWSTQDPTIQDDDGDAEVSWGGRGGGRISKFSLLLKLIRRGRTIFQRGWSLGVRQCPKYNSYTIKSAERNILQA